MASTRIAAGVRRPGPSRPESQRGRDKKRKSMKPSVDCKSSGRLRLQNMQRREEVCLLEGIFNEEYCGEDTEVRRYSTNAGCSFKGDPPSHAGPMKCDQ
jgi:hypothetical protein